MLDRTVAPAINRIEQVTIPEAKKVAFDNGLSLFYINAGQQPVVRLEVVFKAGKWFESIPGQSYFTGKMLTEGTKSFTAKEIAGLFDAYGAFVEVVPGFDRVTLTLHLLTRHLPSILPVLREVVTEPSFQQKELDTIKTRKKQQLLVDLEKNSFVAAQRFTENIFGINHPYGRLLSQSNIEAIERQSVIDFFQKQFSGNYEVIMCGAIGENELELVNKYLGQTPKRTANDIQVTFQPYEATKVFKEKEDSLQSSVRLGMPFINRSHKDYLEMIVVNEILGGYFGSRLMRNIRENKGYTYGIRSVISCLDQASFWTVSTDVKKQFWKQTLEEISYEIGVLRNQQVPKEELETVKNYMLGTFVSSIDTPFALADKFKTIHYSGLDYRYYQQYFKTIKEIDQDRILELSQEYLREEAMTTVVIG